jgi:hypothetical protein
VYAVRAAPGQPSFGHVHTTRARYVLPAPSYEHAALLKLETAEAELDVTQRAEDFQLHARRPFSMGGWYVPQSSRPLKWLGSEGARLRVGVDEIEDVLAAESPALAQPCADLSISSEYVDDDTWRKQVLALLGKKPKRRGVITLEQPLPFARRPGGPVTFLLGVSGINRTTELEVRGEQTLVLIERLHDAIYGWIPRNRFDPNLSAAGAGRGEGYGHGDRGRIVDHRPRLVCPAGARLVVEQGEAMKKTRLPIGRLRANVPVTLLLGEVSPFLVQVESIALADDALLYVEGEGCAVQPPSD